jgi:hypothetical protein
MNKWERAKALLNNDVIFNPTYRRKEKEMWWARFNHVLIRICQAYLFVTLFCGIVVGVYFGVQFIASAHQIALGILILCCIPFGIYIMVRFMISLDYDVEQWKSEANEINQFLEYNRIQMNSIKKVVKKPRGHRTVLERFLDRL